VLRRLRSAHAGNVRGAGDGAEHHQLQQANRQRDPQELYEMLKDRQTLNQLLQDIVEDTKNDSDLKELFKGIKDEAWEKSNDALQKDSIDLQLETSNNVEIESARLTPIQMAQATKLANKKIGERYAKFGITTKEILASLPGIPEGYKFNWKKLKSSSNNYQGELF